MKAPARPEMHSVYLAPHPAVSYLCLVRPRTRQLPSSPCAVRVREFALTINGYFVQNQRVRSCRLVPYRALLIALIGCCFSLSSAWAGYTVTLEQIGPNVVANGSGAIDLTGLHFAGSDSFEVAEMEPDQAVIVMGIFSPPADLYSGFDGPPSFGSGGLTSANTASGDFVGWNGFGLLGVPHGYLSGTPLLDSATYSGATFASLGVTPGTYEWTWGMGVDQNLTLIAVVPEPRVCLLLGAGLLVLLRIGLRQLRFGSRAT
jgi:hypothetical protein